MRGARILARRGTPRTLDELSGHDVVEMPGTDGRPRGWTFSGRGGETVTVEVPPRLRVNEALTIHRLVVNGAGLGCLSGYVCASDLDAGRLVRLFPEWTLPALDVNVVFPSSRELSPTVRAFVDFLKEASAPDESWQDDPRQRERQLMTERA